MESILSLPSCQLTIPAQPKKRVRSTSSFLHLLVSYQTGELNEGLNRYSHHLADMLPGQLNYLQAEIETDTGLKTLAGQVGQSCNLVIFDEPTQSLLTSLFFAPPACKAVKYLPTSVLIPRRPRWPLRRILLVTRGQSSDDCAVDWTIALARPSRAMVTVLAVQPALATTQSDLLRMGGVLDWITTSTPLGRQLRDLEFELDNWLIEGKLRFRRGSLENQIQTEVREGDYDLIILAADAPQWWQRRIPGQLVGPLLQWVDRPVLIAKP